MRLWEVANGGISRPSRIGGLLRQKDRNPAKGDGSIFQLDTKERRAEAGKFREAVREMCTQDGLPL